MPTKPSDEETIRQRASDLDRSGRRSGPSPVGRLLRRWRAARGKSQLDLAFDAEISPRHLSFLETGRAKPSRDMVLRLAEALDVPLRERNVLLEAAGFVRVFRERPLADPVMADVRRVVDFLLERHEPYPAMVVDLRWNVLQSNRAGFALLGAFLDPETLANTPLNAVRFVLDPTLLRPFIVNWAEVAAFLVSRLVADCAARGEEPGDDEVLSACRALPGIPDRFALVGDVGDSPVLPVHLKKGDLELRFLTAVTTLGTARDVTLQELRIESYLPADDATAETMRKLSQF